MMLLRLLGPKGVAGIAVALCLSLLLLLQKAETRRFRALSDANAQRHRAEQAAHAGTVANYRAAAAAARAADKANAARIATEQRAINERTSHDFEARLAAARARADRLRREGQGAADPRARGDAAMPSLPATAAIPAQGPVENRLPHPDALIATEQAIQLDELIKWVRAQHAVRVDGGPGG
ncbi:hypothetical protein H9L13_04760 [Sphingomonas lutea]|uniref:Uncharacterized protein n=1 Tax=Sphingomonas lutea TaxID=1045317 RepID=A0A7G9SK20_9SPHN|nr:hypothetical protein [Sphingomonas lutea]QNN68195.1 hypothetical protein H9L13_04760 [Sphingomonas lutea]